MEAFCFHSSELCKNLGEGVLRPIYRYYVAVIKRHNNGDTYDSGRAIAQATALTTLKTAPFGPIAKAANHNR
jgi:hypothetical protein